MRLKLPNLKIYISSIVMRSMEVVSLLSDCCLPHSNKQHDDWWKTENCFTKKIFAKARSSSNYSFNLYHWIEAVFQAE